MRTLFTGASTAPPLCRAKTRYARAGVALLLACAAFMGMGIARAQQPSFTSLADTNAAAPGGGAYTGFGTVSISGSNVTFQATFNGGSGIYALAQNTGAFSRVADTTTIPSGHDAPFVGFSQPVISGNNIAFNGVYPGNGGNFGGLYLGSVGVTGTSTVAETGQYVNGTSGATFTNFQGGPRVSGGTVLFYAANSSNANRGIYEGSAGSAAHPVVADRTTTVPGQTYNFNTLTGGQGISGSNVVIRGTYFDADLNNHSGLYLSNANGLQVLASEAIQAPNRASGVSLRNFNGPAVSGNNVAFVANSTDGTTSVTGVYRLTIGAVNVSTVADTTMAAPGHGGLSLGTFTAFDATTLSISGTNVVFKGTVDNNLTGIFLSQNGVLTDVINVNDSLFGSTLTSFTLASQALEGGNVVFAYGLADGRFGVAEYGFATVVPEPSTCACIATLIGVFTIVETRRRRMRWSTAKSA